MLDLWRLEKFVSATDDVAEEVFTRHICPHVHRFLRIFLRSYFINPEDREEAIGIVQARLWLNRDRIEIRSPGAWWRYVGRIAHNCAIDQLKRPGDEVPKDQEPNMVFDDEFWDSLDVARLYRAADELWLGIPRLEPAMVREQKLLAAHLFFEGADIATILRTVGRDKSVSRKELDGWLAEASVIDHVAHQTMHAAPEELAYRALRLGPIDSSKSVDKILRDALAGTGRPPEGWSWSEVACGLLRYANGLSEKKIAQYLATSEEFVAATLNKCRQNVQFRTTCERLLGALREFDANRNPFLESGVWKRTVFEYAVRNDYPQKLILELVQPICDLGPFKFNAGILNVWISGDRLSKQLRDYLKLEVAGE